MTELDPPAWERGSEDAIGQVGEFLVWAALVAQSAGRLHIFLPLLDRGIDGLIHRLDDGAYMALQVKARSVLHNSEAPIAVYENHLFTPDQLVIGVHLDGDKLGPYALVADAATFMRKAARIEDRGRLMLVADMPVRPTPGHKWSEDLVPTSELAARLGSVPAAATAAASAKPAADLDRVVGFLGEQEVCRRAAVLDDCGLFRPFPDSEMVEVAVRRLATGQTLGIQVKTVQLAKPHAFGHVLVNRATFVASPSTVIVALAWLADEQRFHETCLVVPAADLPALAGGGPYYELHFHPDPSPERSRLDRYRTPIDELAVGLSRRLGLLPEVRSG